MKIRNQNQGDPLIQAVLEGIFRVTQIDPSTIWPDDDFNEIGVSDKMVDQVLQRCAQSLRLNVSSQSQQKKKISTPRQMVDFFRVLAASENRIAS
jgi:hypothetical protein